MQWPCLETLQGRERTQASVRPSPVLNKCLLVGDAVLGDVSQSPVPVAPLNIHQKIFKCLFRSAGFRSVHRGTSGNSDCAASLPTDEQAKHHKCGGCDYENDWQNKFHCM